MLNFSLPSDNQVGRYTRTLARVQLPLELDPCLITCVAYMRSTLGLSYKVVFGTSDGRLKCCSHNKVIMEVTLEESPDSVMIAESAHGVPVMVVSLGGMDRKVVTFFAESLHQINSWTGIHQVDIEIMLSNAPWDFIFLCRCFILQQIFLYFYLIHESLGIDEAVIFHLEDPQIQS